MNDEYKKLRNFLDDSIRQEEDETEERIENFAKQQRAILKLFCEKAEQDYKNMLSFLHQNPSDVPNLGDDLPANATLLSNLTPSIASDSAPISIDNSPNFKANNSFLNKSRYFSSESNARTENSNQSDRNITSQSNINDNDDIFFAMDGVGNEIKTDKSIENNSNSDNDSDNDDNDNSGKKNIANNGEINYLKNNFFKETIYDLHGGIKVSNNHWRTENKNQIAQSLPMDVPVFTHRKKEDYDEVIKFSL